MLRVRHCASGSLNGAFLKPFSVHRQHEKVIHLIQINKSTIARAQTRSFILSSHKLCTDYLFLKLPSFGIYCTQGYLEKHYSNFKKKENDLACYDEPKFVAYVQKRLLTQPRFLNWDSTKVNQDKLFLIDESLAQRITGEGKSEGILIHAPIISEKHHAPLSSLLLVLWAIQDPRNVGSLLRSAALFGFDVICVGDELKKTSTCDLYGHEAIRSARAVHIFNPSMIINDGNESSKGSVIDTLKQRGYLIIAADSNAENDTKNSFFGTSIPLNTAGALFANRKRIALVMGNESHGIDMRKLQPDHRLHLPLSNYYMKNKLERDGKGFGVDSLNVAVAGSIIMHHISTRQWEPVNCFP